jgi:threonine dehydratase
MSLFTLDQLKNACTAIYREMPATPLFQWPMISRLLNTEVWVKHENHTPTGAFKVRGGITYIDWLKQSYPEMNGLVTATRGNHGQSQVRAATAAGLCAKIVVPENNSVEKNAAMRAFGAEVIEFGRDFDVARTEALRLAEVENLQIVPPFHRAIVLGVASYALELFSSITDLDEVFVPIGCGSGICGLIQTRDLLSLNTRIVGVVSTQADAAKQSFEAGRIIETNSANTFADGMAVRVPLAEAFEIYARGADRIVAVSDDEVAEAMRLYYSSTHNVAEGAGAAALAAALQQKDRIQGKKVALILTGANVDASVFTQVLSGQTPTA